MQLLKLFGIVAVTFFTVALALFIKQRLKRRTIANWSGNGVNDSLTPSEAALLMGLHPGTLIALVGIHLERLGLVRIHDQVPVTVEWVGARPRDELERSFRGALDGEGHLRPAGTLKFFEALYDTVNARMVPYSGRKTAIYYEHMANELWKQMKAGGEPEPAVFPWMLLFDATEIWEEIGDGEGWRELKAMYRVRQHFQSDLFRMKEISGAAKEGKEGFFQYRDDLFDDEYWVAPKEYVEFVNRR